MTHVTLTLHMTFLSVLRENADELAHHTGTKVPWSYREHPSRLKQAFYEVLALLLPQHFLLSPQDTLALGREGIWHY